MALETATISGQLLRPDQGRTASTYILKPATLGGRVTYSGKVQDGGIKVEPAADGTASVTVWKLPQVGVSPASAQWRLIKHSASGVESWVFDLTADVTWDAIVTAATEAPFDDSWRLGDLADVDLAGLSDGDGVFWDDATQQWKTGAGGGGGGTGAVDTVNGVEPDVSGDVTLTKANFTDLDQVDNTADADKPVSDAQQTALDQKAALDHTHDDRYPRLDQTSSIFKWKTGDADPWWVAGDDRPTNMTAWVIIASGGTVPSWVISGDLVLSADVTATAPAIRSFGSFTALTSNATSTDCVIPADVADGDTLWLCVATTGSAPTTPSGWSVEEVYLSSGASSTDGLIIYSRTLTSGQAATLAGTTVTITLGTSTSAVGTVVCWTGAVSVDTVASHTDDANSGTSQTFAGITPGATSKVVGVSAVRYNAISGGTSVGSRTGWTELFDRSTSKAGAPQRGLVFSVLDADGEGGTAVSSASATATQVVRTAEYTISVVPA